MLHFLVTGKNGQLSRSLAERAVLHDIRVTQCGVPELDLSWSHDEIRQTIINISSSVKPDLIVNCAAYTAVDKAETEKDLALAVNGSAPGAVAEAARFLDIPVIHISTDYIFSGQDGPSWTERDIPDPVNHYGRTKLTGELAVQDIWPNHAILRTAWVFSPFGNNFVKTMLRLSEEHSEIRIVHDQFGSPSSALDLADAICRIGEQLCRRKNDYTLRGVFHLAGTGFTDWAGFARIIFEQSVIRGGKGSHVSGIPSSEYPSKAARPFNSCLNTDKTFRTFGIRMPDWKHSLAIVLDRLIKPL